MGEIREIFTHLQKLYIRGKNSIFVKNFFESDEIKAFFYATF